MQTHVDPSIDFPGRKSYDLVQIGRRSYIEQGVSFSLALEAEASPRIVLGDDTFIARNCIISSFVPTTIGSSVMIGAFCFLVGANHGYQDRSIPIKHQPVVGGPISIDDGAWLGTHVVVLPGTTIGRGAIVGAGSVVACNVPPFEIWCGVPAKFLKNRPE